jgi:Ras-related protein Rab-28
MQQTSQRRERLGTFEEVDESVRRVIKEIGSPFRRCRDNPAASGKEKKRDMETIETKIDDASEEETENFQFKVILLGNGAVGKTSICNRFSEDKFSATYKQTVGVDFFIRRVFIPPNYHIALQIWDIGGQSIGSKMITNYIAGADGVLMCYDITNYDSFADLEDWYRLVHKASESGKTPLPYRALVGNKNDLRHMCAVRMDSHNRFADENGMASFLMSAKSGDQVKQAFHKIAATLANANISRSELDYHDIVVPAQIVNHERHDDAVAGGKLPEYTKPKSRCVIQ